MFHIMNPFMAAIQPHQQRLFRKLVVPAGDARAHTSKRWMNILKVTSSGGPIIVSRI
jgi:hypothetical protein